MKTISRVRIRQIKDKARLAREQALLAKLHYRHDPEPTEPDVSYTVRVAG